MAPSASGTGRAAEGDRSAAPRCRRENATPDFLAQRAERLRIRRITRPRVGIAYAISIGLAIVVGSATALTASADATVARYETAVALAAGTLVLALMIVGAAAWRRRSGVLTFSSVLTVVAALGRPRWADEHYFHLPPAVSILRTAAITSPSAVPDP